MWRCGHCEASFPIPSGGKPIREEVFWWEAKAKVQNIPKKYEIKAQNKHLRWRGVAVVIRHGKVLLVKDKGEYQYSLPGGGIHKYERPEQAATRELYEETGLKAKKTTRLGTFKGTANRHLAYLIEAEGHVHLRKDGELEKHIWWNMKEPTPIFNHVREILKLLPQKTEPVGHPWVT